MLYLHLDAYLVFTILYLTILLTLSLKVDWEIIFDSKGDLMFCIQFLLFINVNGESFCNSEVFVIRIPLVWTPESGEHGLPEELNFDVFIIKVVFEIL